MESHLALVRRARRMNSELAKAYPNARCELDFDNPFQLLVATVLSAQSTDRRVNSITPALFAAYPDPEALAHADLDKVEQIIHPTGFFRVKSASIIRLSNELVDNFGGKVPESMDDLVSLQGVGRKTANVVRGNAFGKPGITTDTHLMRLTRRYGWTTSKDPDQVEKDVGDLLPKSEWTPASNRIIWHGRRCCHARKPACGACPVAKLCPSFGEGETDPKKAQKLIREPRA